MQLQESRAQAPALPATPVAPTTVRAIAIYDYDANEPNELSFRNGQIIDEIVQVSDEWWQGTLNGQVGLCKFILILVPYNYVDILP